MTEDLLCGRLLVVAPPEPTLDAALAALPATDATVIRVAPETNPDTVEAPEVDALLVDLRPWRLARDRHVQVAVWHRALPTLPLLGVVPAGTPVAEQVTLARAGAQDVVAPPCLDCSQSLWRAVALARVRSQSQQELEHSRQRLADFVVTASDWFWESGPDHRITWLSPRFREITGLGPEVMLHHRRDEVLYPEYTGPDWGALCQELAAVLSMGPGGGVMGGG